VNAIGLGHTAADVGVAVGDGDGVAVGGTAVNVAMARPNSNLAADFDPAWSPVGVAEGSDVAVAVGVSAGTGVRLDIAMIVAATLATRVASASGVGVGIAAVHAVSSNIRVVDSTSSFMDISFISTRSRCT
jgi:hypothetical protein